METRNLPVKLTTEELNQRRDQIARLVEDRIQLELEKKAEAKRYSEELKASDEEITQIAFEIRTKEQVREVAVSREKDMALNFESVIRTDTGEEIARLALQPSERQAELGLVQPIREAVDGLKAAGMTSVSTTVAGQTNTAKLGDAPEEGAGS